MSLHLFATEPPSAADAPPHMKIRQADLAYRNIDRLSGGKVFMESLRPAADAPPHMKIRRADLAYRNIDRLSGGRVFMAAS